MNKALEISGNLVDIFQESIYPVIIRIREGRILEIHKTKGTFRDYILPGLVDSHIHIESSMLTPAHFAEAAVQFGTVATVSDPHEIANVLGVEGVDFMIRNGNSVPFKFFFGAPSCVPATGSETSGAVLNAEDVSQLLSRNDIWFLSEMMNFPGVIHSDPQVMAKLASAKNNRKKIDGHAPGLSGKDLDKYIGSGIQTDHESSSYEEALEKLSKGMIIQIREGSAARNFEHLWKLIDEYPGQVMLCSDDLHPNDLVKGHLNRLLARGIGKGIDLFHIIQAVTKNPVEHYGINVGLLREGDPADFVVMKDLVNFSTMSTWIDGNPVFSEGKINFKSTGDGTPNIYFVNDLNRQDLQVPVAEGKLKVIDAIDGELITRKLLISPRVENGFVVSDPGNDILKIIVLNRYKKEKPAVGFIHNFGLKNGALASSIAHDSHNVIAVGTDDSYILEIIDWIHDNRGGIAFHDGTIITGLPLPVAGIISGRPATETARLYEKVNRMAREAGTNLQSPFMTLSFMALLVIPELKIGNKGLFDVGSFQLTSLFE